MQYLVNYMVLVIIMEIGYLLGLLILAVACYRQVTGYLLVMDYLLVIGNAVT